MCTKQLPVLHYNNLLIQNYFKEVHDVLAFQKLITCRSNITAT